MKAVEVQRRSVVDDENVDEERGGRGRPAVGVYDVEGYAARRGVGPFTGALVGDVSKRVACVVGASIASSNSSPRARGATISSSPSCGLMVRVRRPVHDDGSVADAATTSMFTPGPVLVVNVTSGSWSTSGNASRPGMMGVVEIDLADDEGEWPVARRSNPSSEEDAMSIPAHRTGRILGQPEREPSAGASVSVK